MTAVLERPAALPSRDKLADFYDAYFEALDDLRLEEWPNFFADDCLFQIIPRENFDAGYQLCTIQADSKGMLVDRVQGILKTQMFAPRTCRRFYSGLRATGRDKGLLKVRQNVVVIQTLIDGPSLVHICGVGYDLLEEAGAEFRFRERILVIDSEMIPNSLIYPA